MSNSRRCAPQSDASFPTSLRSAPGPVGALANIADRASGTAGGIAVDARTAAAPRPDAGPFRMSLVAASGVVCAQAHCPGVAFDLGSAAMDPGSRITPFTHDAVPAGRRRVSAWPSPGTASRRTSACCPFEMFPGQDWTTAWRRGRAEGSSVLPNEKGALAPCAWYGDTYRGEAASRRRKVD